MYEPIFLKIVIDGSFKNSLLSMTPWIWIGQWYYTVANDIEYPVFSYDRKKMCLQQAIFFQISKYKMLCSELF